MRISFFTTGDVYALGTLKRPMKNELLAIMMKQIVQRNVKQNSLQRKNTPRNI